ncbi:MAG: ABC transporter substrate-binding protein [Pseudomonadota bacterium]|nr:ABC transporter substrate-binding protein [Pseudomonadota bacterium]MEC8293296.1 ABC transporter substrate-binding protein [Pseudomonadota bacterium]
MRWLWLMAIFALVSPAGAEPREIEHRYGTTHVDGTPTRVVSLSFIGHDFLLSLGVKPIALRYWYGNHPYGVWPWAQEALGDATPQVIYGEINIEQIALMQPDLIVGQWSGMTETDYRFLSQIAPTLPPAKGEGDYSSSWQTMTRQLGLALNRMDQAEAIITRLEDRFAEVRAAHPEWQGKSSAVVWPARISAYTSKDIRSRFLTDFGFAAQSQIDEQVGANAFLVNVPQEDLTPIDVDLLMWTETANLPQALDGIALRKTMRAYREGREIYADPDLTAALAHSSPLSLDYAIEHMIPLVASAMDGDPKTQVATMAAEGVAP